MSRFPVCLRRWIVLGLGTGLMTTGCQLVNPAIPPGSIVIVPPPSTELTELPAEPKAVPKPLSAKAIPAKAPTTVIQAAAVESTGPSATGSNPSIIPTASGALTTANATTIDLGSALALAGVDNPTIALARERVRESLAQQTAARVLLLPSLTGGLNYHYHTGNLQRGPGSILDVSSQSFYIGAGAQAIGSQTVVIPGVRLFAHLGDAVLEPRAASQRVTARNGDALAIQNRTLLAVSRAYLELVGADATVTFLNESEKEFAEIVRITTAYAKAGQGLHSDAERATTNFNLVHSQRLQAEGEVATASARLAGLLNIDPTAKIMPIPGAVLPITLVDEQGELEGYLLQALTTRPERVARGAELAEARTRIRQEVLRPWLPTISAGVSAGGFGGGGTSTTSATGQFAGRTDIDVMAVWSVQNLGVGNRALERRASARAGQAAAALIATDNQIRAEVTEALAMARAARVQLTTAQQALVEAEDGAKEERTRIKAEVGRPLETLDTLRQANDARLELIRATTAHNIAQFQLWVALGGTPKSP